MKTTKEIITKLKLKNPKLNSLDFSEFEFYGTKIKSTIICPRHGKYQRSYHRLLNWECPECYRENFELSGKPNQFSGSKIIKYKKLLCDDKQNTINYFIETLRINKPKLLKNLTFDKSIYYNQNQPIIVTCNKKDSNGNIHGNFMIKPVNILQSKNECCPKCTDKKYFILNDKYIYKKQLEFPKNMKHFDYSKYDKDVRTPYVISTIICTKHNIEFQDSLYKHFKNNTGCIECEKEKTQNKKPKNINILEILKGIEIYKQNKSRKSMSDIMKILESKMKKKQK